MRAAQIAELKANGPKPKPRRKRTLTPVQDVQVAHFNNLAAKAKALGAYPQPVEVNGNIINLRAPRNSVEVGAEVNAGRIPHKLIHAVPVKIKTHSIIDKPGEPQQPRQITLVTGRKLEPEDFMVHALALAQINPLGFRQPSAKAKNYKSTSLMEKISIQMGVSKPRVGPERSERGQKKLEAQIECNTRIVLDRLIEQYPDRARKAKKEERLRSWFVGKVMEALSGTPKLEDLEIIVAQRIEKVKVPKHVIEFDEFKHRAVEEAKRRVENSVLDRQARMEVAA